MFLVSLIIEGYATFALSWASSTFSQSGISGMFHPFKTKGDSHIPMIWNCNTLAYCETHFIKVSELGWSNEYVFNIYIYFEKQSSNNGITIDPMIGLRQLHVWSYHLYNKKDNYGKMGLPNWSNTIAHPGGNLLKKVVFTVNFR